MVNAIGITDQLREILVVEDDPDDLRLTVAALGLSGIKSHVTSVTDGEAAVEYLKQQGDHATALRPDLVFLDMNLPRISGHQVLLTMKSDLHLRQIPTIMLSGSTSENDITEAYDAQIAAYIVKPFSFDAYVSAIRAVVELWFLRAALPRRVI